jgi:hypothetical protein
MKNCFATVPHSQTKCFQQPPEPGVQPQFSSWGTTFRVVNPGIRDFGIVKSRDLNFAIFGIILIPGFAYRDPGLSGKDFIN